METCNLTKRFAGITAQHIESMAAALMLQLERDGIAANTPVENIELVQYWEGSVSVWRYRIKPPLPIYCPCCDAKLSTPTAYPKAE